MRVRQATQEAAARAARRASRRPASSPEEDGAAVLVGGGVTARVGVGTGAPTTVRPAEPAAPGPPSVEPIGPVLSVKLPPETPTIVTEKVQEAPARRVASARLIVVPPADAPMVPPPQLPVRPLGVATTNPAGRVSLKPMEESVITPTAAGRTPGATLPLGFLTVNDRDVEPPVAIEDVPKAALMVGAT